MPQQVPALRAARIIAALERAGLVVKRQTGSHVILVREGLRRPIVVPMHRRELPPGTVRDIIRQAGITVDDGEVHEESAFLLKMGQERWELVGAVPSSA